jgi:hypothetical protein
MSPPRWSISTPETSRPISASTEISSVSPKPSAPRRRTLLLTSSFNCTGSAGLGAVEAAKDIHSVEPESGRPAMVLVV